jgi:hypothetical protein
LLRYEWRCKRRVKLYNLEGEDEETKIKVEVDLKLFQMEPN